MPSPFPLGGGLFLVYGSQAGPASYTNGTGFSIVLPPGAVVYLGGFITTGEVLMPVAALPGFKAFWSGTASAVLNEVTNATNLSTGTVYWLALIQR